MGGSLYIRAALHQNWILEQVVCAAILLEDHHYMLNLLRGWRRVGRGISAPSSTAIQIDEESRGTDERTPQQQHPGLSHASFSWRIYTSTIFKPDLGWFHSIPMNPSS